MQYREQIATLRKFEKQRKASAAKRRMKKSVGKHVTDNEETREELREIQIEVKKGRETNDG